MDPTFWRQKHQKPKNLKTVCMLLHTAIQSFREELNANAMGGTPMGQRRDGFRGRWLTGLHCWEGNRSKGGRMMLQAPWNVLLPSSTGSVELPWGLVYWEDPEKAVPQGCGRMVWPQPPRAGFWLSTEEPQKLRVVWHYLESQPSRHMTMDFVGMKTAKCPSRD